MGFVNDISGTDAAAFVDTDVFGESVVYVKADGTTRTIKAMVDRGVIDAMPGADPALRMNLTVMVTNNATTGISSAELDRGDRIRFDADLGGTTTTRPINTQTAIIDQGMLKLELT